MKVAIQIQGIAPDLGPVLATRPPSIKLLGNALDIGVAQRIRDLSPSTLIVLRYAGGNQAFKEPVAQAIDFGNEARRVFDKFLVKGLVDYVEGINEPIVNTADDARRLNEWQVAYSNLMQSSGYRVGAYCFSVGHPKLRFFDGNEDKWQYLHDGLRASDMLFLHEYSAPTMQTGQGAYCLRYRHIYEGLPIDARRPIGITECGIDGGVIAGQLGGYKQYTSIASFVEQLKWYAGELEKDAYVRFAHIFLYGRSDDRWLTFDVAEPDSDRTAFISFLKTNPTPPPPPPPPPKPNPMKPIPPSAINAIKNVGGIVQEGKPVTGKKFYRLVGAVTKPNINATIHATVLAADNRPEVGTQVIGLRPDGKGQVELTDASGNIEVQMRATAIFFEPGGGPFSVFVVENGVKDEDTKLVSWDNVLSDVVQSLGDWQALHQEIYLQFVEQDPNPSPPPPPPPDDIPTVKDDEGLRDVVLKRIAATQDAVSYNPIAAMSQRARTLRLGKPEATEFRYLRDGKKFACQPFALAILHCSEGDWDNIVSLDY